MVGLSQSGAWPGRCDSARPEDRSSPSADHRQAGRESYPSAVRQTGTAGPRGGRAAPGGAEDPSLVSGPPAILPAKPFGRKPGGMTAPASSTGTVWGKVVSCYRATHWLFAACSLACRMKPHI